MARQGYSAVADVLTQTQDGRPLSEIWSEFIATLQLQNEVRQPLIDFLTFPVATPIEDVAQQGGSDFEKASEFGVPKGLRGGDVYQMGYTFDWYDLAARYTWQYLAEASSGQIESIHQAALEADNRLMFLEVMRTLFRNTNRLANIKGQNYNVYTFWNNDGTTPPAFKNNTFASSHNHYRTSGAATVDQGDLNEIIDDFKSHGYGPDQGSTLLLLVNSVEANVIRTLRVASGARHDFIPSVGSGIGLLLPTGGLQGSQVASTYNGMNVIGSYGQMLIIEEDYVPAGYIVGLASGGKANLANPIGLREHANPALRGIRLVKGADADYPLIDSYYSRGFGTGVRQRGAGLVMQITVSGSYTIPAIYA